MCGSRCIALMLYAFRKLIQHSWKNAHLRRLPWATHRLCLGWLLLKWLWPEALLPQQHLHGLHKHSLSGIHANFVEPACLASIQSTVLCTAFPS